MAFASYEVGLILALQRNAAITACENRQTKLTVKKGTIRIIGGRWRSRRIDVPGSSQVRPTPDSVRETLFNWLAADLNGARCLDLFAGSGALGLEARSRGAEEVVFVEQDARVVKALRRNCQRVDAGGMQVIHRDAMSYLNAPHPHGEFDVVFADPPYARTLLATVMQRLVDCRWLTPEAKVYAECASEDAAIAVPANLRLHREGTSGGSTFRLYRHEVDR